MHVLPWGRGRGRLRIDYKRGTVSLSRVALLAALLTLVSGAALALAVPRDAGATASSNVVDFYGDPDKYWDLVEDGIVLVFVEQENCLGCKKLRPYVLEYADLHPEVKVVRLHVDKMIQRYPDEAWDLIGELGIYGTPTLLLYRDGVELARYVGTFSGDQMEGLEEFVRAGLGGEPGHAASPEPGAAVAAAAAETAPTAAAQLGGLAGAVTALALGLAAAFSPCSAPLLAVYTASASGSPGGLRVPREQLLRSNAALLAIVGAGGIALALFATFIPSVAGLPVTTILLVYAGWLLVLWGSFEYAGRTVVSRGLEGASRLLPLLGLQCSLPFLLTALAVAATDVATAAAAAIAFSLGFSLPYMLAGTAFATVLRPVARWMGANVRARSAILVAAGVFLIYYGGSLALAG